MIEDTILESVKVVAKSMKIDVVLNDSSVLIGGNDITEAVTTYLNKSSK
jgi:Skp family chaperone for outer membrane proteins